MMLNSLPDKLRLLIAEDDIENQKYLQLILKKHFEVFLCDSAESFNEIIMLNQFDVILMDISLKGSKNGIQIIKELKRKDIYKNIPVVCLSAHVFNQDKQKAIDAGADMYLTKPVDNKLLIQTLLNLTRSQEFAY